MQKLDNVYVFKCKQIEEASVDLFFYLTTVLLERPRYARLFASSITNRIVCISMKRSNDNDDGHDEERKNR